MQAIKHKVSDSTLWLNQGFKLLSKKPVTLIGIFIMAGVLKVFIIMMASALIAIMGAIALPYMSLAVMQAIVTAIPGLFVFVYVFRGLSWVERDNSPNILNLFSIFTRSVSLKLLKISLVFACVEALLNIVQYLVLGNEDLAFLAQILQNRGDGSPAFSASTVMMLLFHSYLEGLSSFVFGFAGVIAASSQTSAGQSLFYAFYGTLIRNFLPFTMLMILLAGVIMIVGFVGSLLLLLLGFVPLLGFLVMLALALAIGMIAMAAGYYFYKHTFIFKGAQDPAVRKHV